MASVVNAIGESQYWDSTAIVVVWDDWGGFYDNVPPPIITITAGSDSASRRSSSRRTLKAGTTSRTTQYEFGSILRYIEDNWGSAQLGTTRQSRHEHHRLLRLRAAADSVPADSVVKIERVLPAREALVPSTGHRLVTPQTFFTTLAYALRIVLL